MFFLTPKCAGLTSCVVAVEREPLKREIDPTSHVRSTNDVTPQAPHVQEEILDGFDDEGPWYLGRAREEFQRRRQQFTRHIDDDEDAVEVGFLAVSKLKTLNDVGVSVRAREKECRK